MLVDFEKWHSCGNHFVIIHVKNPMIKASLARQSASICQGKTGVGGDGLILLMGQEVEIWNQDGSQAFHCGNGLRCLTAFAHEKGLIKNQGVFKVQEKVISGFWEDGLTSISWDGWIKPEIVKGSWGEGAYLSNGNRHIILEFEAPVSLLQELCQQYDANVHVLQEKPSSQIKKPPGIEVSSYYGLTSWERGVGFTSSCGTAAGAAAVWLHSQGWGDNRWMGFCSPGGCLWVKTDGHSTSLLGPVERSFWGTFDL